MTRPHATAALLLTALLLLPGPVGAEPGAIRWTTQRGTRIDGSPAYAGDGTIYIGSNDNFLYAIEAADGSERWRFQTGGAIISSPAVGADGTIYIGADDGVLYAVTSDGAERWTFDTGGRIRSSPGIGPDGTVHVGSDDGAVYAVDGADGALVWEFPTDGPVLSRPAIDDAGTVDDVSDDTIYFGSDDTFVYAVDANGVERWRFKTEGEVRSSPAIGADGTVYIGADDGKVYALDPAETDDLRVRWSHDTEGAVRSSPALSTDGTILYVGSLNGPLHALRTEDDPGERVQWAFLDSGPIHASPAIGSDGTIYFGARDARLYAVDPDGEAEWTVRIRDTLSSPLVAPDGTLYIGSLSEGSAATGGRLYAVETDSQGLSDGSAWPTFGHDIRNTGRNSQNQGPTAEAGADQTVVDGESVLLNGTGSTDPDYGISEYQWTQTDGPSVELTEEGFANARFVAPGADDQTALVFELTVTDIGGLRSTDTVSITVEEDSSFCFLAAIQTGGGAGGSSPAVVWGLLIAVGGTWIRRRSQ